MYVAVGLAPSSADSVPKYRRPMSRGLSPFSVDEAHDRHRTHGCRVLVHVGDRHGGEAETLVQFVIVKAALKAAKSRMSRYNRGTWIAKSSMPTDDGVPVEVTGSGMSDAI